MYATVAKLRTYLPQVPAGTAEDALFTDVLTRATDMVRNAFRAALADPAFDFAAYTTATPVLVRGYPTAYLPLPPHEAGSVTLVEEETGSNPASYTAITDQWLEEDGRLYRAGRWWFGRYRVTANWGYGETVPPAVEELTLQLAVNLWRAKDQGGYSETVGVDGAGAIRMVAGLNRQQQQIVTDLVAQLWQVSV